MFLSGGTTSQVHLCGVRKPLRQEVAGDGVLILPLDDCHGLILGGLGSVGRVGARVQASEVGPSVCHFHGVAEAHLKDGPVRSVGLKAWDVGWELLNSGRRGSGWR